MRLDGISQSEIDTFFNGENEPILGIPPPNRAMAKYEKMKRMGMPRLAIQNKMKLDGVTDSAIEEFFNENYGMETKMELARPSPMEKWEKMRRMGIPEQAIKQKMQLAGFSHYDISKFFNR